MILEQQKFGVFKTNIGLTREVSRVSMLFLRTSNFIDLFIHQYIFPKVADRNKTET